MAKFAVCLLVLQWQSIYANLSIVPTADKPAQVTTQLLAADDSFCGFAEGQQQKAEAAESKSKNLWMKAKDEAVKKYDDYTAVTKKLAANKATMIQLKTKNEDMVKKSEKKLDKQVEEFAKKKAMAQFRGQFDKTQKELEAKQKNLQEELVFLKRSNSNNKNVISKIKSIILDPTIDGLIKERLQMREAAAAIKPAESL